MEQKIPVLEPATTQVTTSADSTSSDLSKNNLSSLFFCLDFACRKHADQRRKDPQQTPYINHPIGVANILINEGHVSDLDVLQAAVLHDTVEDTDTTLEELKANFGAKIASLVDEVTDDKSLPKEVRKQLQIEHALTSSHGAKLVKMADKIYNLRDINSEGPVGWSDERKLEYVQWAQKVVQNCYSANEALANILRGIFAKWNVENKNVK